MKKMQRGHEMTLKEKLQVMTSQEIRRAIDRLASEILERNGGVENLLLVGIRTGGMHLAARLKKRLTKMEGEVPAYGIIDITLYRDDLFSLDTPEVGTTEIEGDITGKRVVLIDDVIYTGRTIRAAMDALIDFGRPKVIQLAVLVDRGLRELPIHADFVGRMIPTSEDERVEVLLKEEGHDDRVVIYDITPDEEG